MRVLVLGGGVMGVSSAYQFARDGHDVTVVDRHPVAGNEASFASNGLHAAGHAYTWNSPQALQALLKSLYRDDQPLQLKLRANPQIWSWGLRFIRNCTSSRSDRHTIQQLKLCLYSREVFNAVVDETGIAFDRETGGCLYVYRNHASFLRGAEKMRILQENGLLLQLLDPDGVAARDAAFAPVKDRIAGAIYAPGDESGDVNRFTRDLAGHCAKIGVTFRYGATATGLTVADGKVCGVRTDAGDLTADAYVVALGNASASFVRPIGIRLHIYPVKGYSVTIPVNEGHVAPRMGGVDESTLLGFSRLGDRLRLTSIAEFSGDAPGHRPSDFTPLVKSAQDLFPQGGDYSRPSYWTGFRPMTPEGPPLICQARYPNLYLNTGHGHLGWTISSGSARVLADLVAGRKPDVDISGLPAC